MSTFPDDKMMNSLMYQPDKGYYLDESPGGVGALPSPSSGSCVFNLISVHSAASCTAISTMYDKWMTWAILSKDVLLGRENTEDVESSTFSNVYDVDTTQTSYDYNDMTYCQSTDTEETSTHRVVTPPSTTTSKILFIQMEFYQRGTLENLIADKTKKVWYVFG